MRVQAAKKRLWLPPVLQCCLLTIVLAGPCSIVPLHAEISDADRTLAEKVFQQLLAATPASGNMPWPPRLELVDTDEINAFAAMRKKDDKEYSVVVCYAVLIKRDVEGNADRLAYILGHELAHHVLGHTKVPSGGTEFLRAT